MGLRLVGVAIGVQYGVTVGGRRNPARADRGLVRVRIRGAPAVPPAPRCRADRASPRSGRARSVRAASQASGHRSSRCATRSRHSRSASSPRSTQVGYFRAAQAPITGFEALSAPVRLILLTEQTRDVEEGRIADTFRSLRRYVLGASLVALVLAPFAWVLMPWLVRVVLGEQLHPRHGRRSDPAPRRLPAARARLDEVVPGLDRQARGCGSSPTASRSRRCCRSSSCSATEWGATGAAVAVLIAHDRVRRRLGGAALPAAARAPSGRLTRQEILIREVLVVSGIWPPDVGGPASHAPDVAEFLRPPAIGRGRDHRGRSAGCRRSTACGGRRGDSPSASGTRTRSR